MEPLVGRVYVLSNSAMPGLVKIGFTMGTVENRAAELSSTGVPAPFKIEYQAECRDAQRVEQQIHKAFKAKRFLSGREFFYVTREEARLKIREICCVIDEENNFPVTPQQIEAECARIREAGERVAAAERDRIERDLRIKEYRAKQEQALEAERLELEKRNNDASACRCLPEYEYFYDTWKKIFGDVGGLRHFVDPSLVSVEGNRLTYWQISTAKRTPDIFPANTVTHKMRLRIERDDKTGALTWRAWDGFYDRGGALVKEKTTNGGAFAPENWKGFELLANLPKVREFMQA